MRARISLAGLVTVAIAASCPRVAEADVVTLQPALDNSLFSESGALSNALGPGLFVGHTNMGNLRRALLEFDVAGSIPAGSTVTAVELTMFVSNTNTGDLTVGLHRALGAWGEGTSSSPGGAGATATAGDATWTHRLYDTATWVSPGGDHAAAASASIVVGIDNASYTWSSPAMASDVQSWLDDASLNHGWLIDAPGAAPGQTKRFDSREIADPTHKPSLIITFDPPAPVGACCMPDGSCTTVLDPGGDCAGAYQGIDTDCATTICAQPTGACCVADAAGGCAEVAELECAGTYQGDLVACAPDLCPVVLTPFVDPLPILPVAQPVSGEAGGVASYQLAFTQLQQVLHSELPPTTVWGFDDGSSGPIFPGPTIEARRDAPIDVTWLNDLRDDRGELLTSHHLPVDPCPHGAVDEARAVMHLHGGHVPAAFDGHPELALAPGESAMYEYPNAQPAASLWYHDHTLGITRLNVQMGLAGFYLIRDPAEDALPLPSGAHDVVLALQDRSFHADGSLQYPAQWSDHAFGNATLVNGRVWPYLDVARGKYRFRVLNAAGSRTYRLALDDGAPLQQIASDGGLLDAPVPITQLILMPGERADLVVDFEGYAPGTQIELTNDAPAPWPDGMDGMHDVPQVMRFVVSDQPGHVAALPTTLVPVVLPDEGDAAVERDFELRRATDACSDGAWLINGLGFHDITEMPTLGSAEVWRFINRSDVAHPMHLHLVQFRVLDRQPFEVVGDEIVPLGEPSPPADAEAGYKDTVRVEPSEIVRLVARFDDYTGPFAYHCHILEHEDQAMMRQFVTVTECGDGVLGVPAEGCDDGNKVSGDGCSDECQDESTGEGGAGVGGGGDGGGSGGGGGSDAADDEGCACRLASSRGDVPLPIAAALIGLVTFFRRRAAPARRRHQTPDLHRRHP